MAWPTSTASTANVDSGSDNPGSARADIKQNIDNVNSIINEFGTVNITSPSDGDSLVYDSGSSEWVNSAYGGATGTAIANLSMSTSIASFPVSGEPRTNYQRLSFDGEVDVGGFTSYSAPSIVLPAGTYTIQIAGNFSGTNIGSAFKLYNETAAGYITNWAGGGTTINMVAISQTSFDGVTDKQLFTASDVCRNTFGATTTLTFEIEIDQAGSSSGYCMVTITKS